MASDPIDTEAWKALALSIRDAHYARTDMPRLPELEVADLADRVGLLCDEIDRLRAALAGSKEPDMDPFAYQQRVVDALDGPPPDLGTWTQEDIDRINARAAEIKAWLDPPPPDRVPEGDGKWRTVPDGWEVRFRHRWACSCGDTWPASACPGRVPRLVPVSQDTEGEETVE